MSDIDIPSPGPSYHYLLEDQEVGVDSQSEIFPQEPVMKTPKKKARKHSPNRKPPKRRGNFDTWVVDYLTRNGASLVKDVYDVHPQGVSASSVRKALADLAKRGVLVSVRHTNNKLIYDIPRPEGISFREVPQQLPLEAAAEATPDAVETPQGDEVPLFHVKVFADRAEIGLGDLARFLEGIIGANGGGQ